MRSNSSTETAGKINSTSKSYVTIKAHNIKTGRRQCYKPIIPEKGWPIEKVKCERGQQLIRPVQMLDLGKHAVGGNINSGNCKQSQQHANMLCER